MRIYFDTCCYNRPFDDLLQERIRQESDAILAITNKNRKDKFIAMYKIVSDHIERDDMITKRALQLQQEGMHAMDSMHVIAGMLALQKALGSVGTIRFLQHFGNGNGDYTKEKYEQKELSMEEVIASMDAEGKAEGQNEGIRKGMLKVSYARFMANKKPCGCT